MASSALVRDGGVAFFAAMAVANGANFAFHVVMSRQLGPSTYGALGSILGVSTAVTLGATAFQAAVTQVVAGAPDSLRHGPAGLAVPWRRSLVPAAVVLGALGAAAPSLEGFLHLATPMPVVLLAVFVASTVATLVPQGVLIGRLRFPAVAVALVAGSVARLAAGPLFVHLGWGLDGAAGAVALNGAVTLSAMCWPLRAELFRQRGPAVRFPVGASAPAVFALGGVSVFVGTDTFLARHFLSPSASGYYAAAATAARIALFLPAAVGMLAFPRLVAERGVGPAARAVLGHATAAVAALGAAAVLVLVLAPRLVVDVLFGDRYRPAVPALRILAVAAALVGLATVFVYGLLARRAALSAVAWLATAILVLAVALAHRSTVTIAWMVLAASVGLAALAGAAVAVGGRASRQRPLALHTGAGPPIAPAESETE